MNPPPSTVRVRNWERAAQRRREQAEHREAANSYGVLLVSSAIGLGLAFLAAVLAGGR